MRSSAARSTSPAGRSTAGPCCGSPRDDHVLLLSFHHIVFDGWSFAVLLDELADCYAAYGSGQIPELPRRALDYRDYAALAGRLGPGAGRAAGLLDAAAGRGADGPRTAHRPAPPAPDDPSRGRGAGWRCPRR